MWSNLLSGYQNLACDAPVGTLCVLIPDISKPTRYNKLATTRLVVEQLALPRGGYCLLSAKIQLQSGESDAVEFYSQRPENIMLSFKTRQYITG